MSYERVPKQFMEGIFIAPKNFNDPQNPNHGQYVNMQLKHDLYNSTLYQITSCEFGLFGSSDQEIEVKSMKNCQGPDPIWGISSKLNNKKSEDNELLACQDWTINHIVNGKKTAHDYRVKIMQSQSDLFYPQIHPPTFWKLFKFYVFS